MKHLDSHLSDQQLLLDVEGELSAQEEKLLRAHLPGCWTCRARRQQLESAIADFVRVYQQDFAEQLPPAAGPRALLRARMAQLSADEPHRQGMFARPRWLAWSLAAAVCGLLAVGSWAIRSGVGRSRPQGAVFSIPDSRLTPGAAILASRLEVCSQANTKNKAVSPAVQRRVFEEYGIAGAEPRAYEVDYLVTPALGGADDIRNLWPHSYSATMWNAPVKDALEDRLREMVCEGSLELTEAQKEIAANWIEAYKKYFHTDRPLEQHSRPEPIQ